MILVQTQQRPEVHTPRGIMSLRDQRSHHPKGFSHALYARRS
jgi:hypothetical protein